MNVYAYCPRGTYEDEMAAIKALCKLEGFTFSLPVWTEDYRSMIRRYYKGNCPAIVIGRYPPDVPEDPSRVVLYGYWAFVEYIQKNGLVRC